MIKLEQILVTTDFSETSDSALMYGRALAQSFGAQLHVVHVVENFLMWAGPEGMMLDPVQIDAEMEQAARQTLSAMIGVDEVNTKTVVLRGASPAFAIADYAKNTNIDLIVIGTHGRGAVSHMLIGSVAERVVRIAPCPVLTIRSREHEFVLPDALQTVAARKK
jgi:universal stress protein A